LTQKNKKNILTIFFDSRPLFSSCYCIVIVIIVMQDKTSLLAAAAAADTHDSFGFSS
jgi:hypothetical protein